MTATKPGDNLLSQGTLLEMMKHAHLQKQKFLLAPPDGKASWLDMPVIQSSYVPPGQYYLVDKTDNKWYNGKWPERYEIALEDRADLASANFKAQYMQDMMSFVNTRMDEKVLYNALGMDRAKDILSYTMPENACEACHGSGKFNNEECWHCLGEGDDPTK